MLCIMPFLVVGIGASFIVQTEEPYTRCKVVTFSKSLLNAYTGIQQETYHNVLVRVYNIEAKPI